MASKFVHGDQVWKELRALANGGTVGHVAVAYLGTGAFDRLPLPADSVLVVDASVGAVRSGQTNPNELAKYVRNDVKVYSHRGLHAKVYAFPNTAFIGSPNVSRSSEETLLEAAIRTTDPKLVEAARRFVLDLRRGRLYPSDLKLLTNEYTPPKRCGGGSRRPGKTRDEERLWVMSSETKPDWTTAEKKALDRGLPQAERSLTSRRRFEVDVLPWYRDDKLLSNIGRGHKVVEIHDTGRGSWVYSPAAVTNVERVVREGMSDGIMVFLERAKDSEPMRWSSFSRKLKSRGIDYIRPWSGREITNEMHGDMIDAILEANSADRR